MMPQQFPTAPTAQVPFHLRYDEALSAPLSQRCVKLTELIHDSLLNNPRDIHIKYVHLVENIFGFLPPGAYPFGSPPDWTLRTLTRAANSEFNAVIEFLSPSGMFFKLVKNLMNDPSNRYNFPIDCLSLNTVQQFKDGMIPPFYLNKFPSSSPNAISLNPFELYMFHFAYYITNTSTLKKTSQTENDNVDVVYHNLLQTYLEVFFPDSPIGQTPGKECPGSFSSPIHQSSPSIWRALSSTTTNLLNLSALKGSPHESTPITPQSAQLPVQSSTPKTPFNRGPFQSPKQESRLFSPALFQNRQNLNQSVITSVDSDSIGTQIYKSETLLNIFTEFWLNHVPEKPAPTVGVSVSFNLTIDHMRAIRVMVKHFHLFTSRAIRRKADNFGSASFMHHSQLNSGGFVHSSFSDPLEELRANLWTSKYPVQRKLYSLLAMAFKRWHNDSSFRIPLETWLSYIQPWRYFKHKPMSEKENKKDEDDSAGGGSADLSDYKRFIQENLFFYTVIFKQVLDRIANILDLNVSAASHFMFRLTKVFKKPGLMDAVRESELSFLRSSNFALSAAAVQSSPLNQSPSSSPVKTPSKSINAMSKTILSDLDPGAVNESVFSPKFRDSAIVLVRKIARQMYLLESGGKPVKTDRSESGFIASVSRFLMLDGDTGMAGTFATDSAKVNNIAKTKHHFEMSIKYLAEILGIPDESVSTILSREQSLVSAGDQLDCSNSEDIYETIDEGLAKLNDRGRQLVASGTLDRRMLKHISDFNPDTQPVRSYECALIIPITIMLSNIINERFGDKLQQLYSRNNVVGTLMQMVLAKPARYVEYVKSSDRHAPEMVVRQLPARVCLRFLSWNIWLLFALLYVIYCLICYAPLSISVTLVVAGLLGALTWTMYSLM